MTDTYEMKPGDVHIMDQSHKFVQIACGGESGSSLYALDGNGIVYEFRWQGKGGSQWHPLSSSRA